MPYAQAAARNDREEAARDVERARARRRELAGAVLRNAEAAVKAAEASNNNLVSEVRRGVKLEYRV